MTAMDIIKKILHITVKLVKDHSRDQVIVFCIDRWSLYKGMYIGIKVVAGSACKIGFIML